MQWAGSQTASGKQMCAFYSVLYSLAGKSLRVFKTWMSLGVCSEPLREDSEGDILFQGRCLCFMLFSSQVYF